MSGIIIPAGTTVPVIIRDFQEDFLHLTHGQLVEDYKLRSELDVIHIRFNNNSEGFFPYADVYLWDYCDDCEQEVPSRGFRYAHLTVTAYCINCDPRNELNQKENNMNTNQIKGDYEGPSLAIQFLNFLQDELGSLMECGAENYQDYHSGAIEIEDFERNDDWYQIMINRYQDWLDLISERIPNDHSSREYCYWGHGNRCYVVDCNNFGVMTSMDEDWVNCPHYAIRICNDHLRQMSIHQELALKCGATIEYDEEMISRVKPWDGEEEPF